jgi:ABC-type Fe3+-hydroxamate transport system substrate-binding protein
MHPAGPRSLALRTALAASAAVACAAIGCRGETSAPRFAARDDFGDSVALRRVPSRIVSLNPTTTELLFALGAGPRLVGRTHWDLWPEAARRVPDLGPGLRPNVEAVLAARPDVVILYASADNRAAAARLRAAGIPTVALKVDRVEDFRRAVALLGRLVGDTASAAVIADSVQRTLDAVRRATDTLPRPRVFWHVWDAPVITIGGGSYMNQLVEVAGGRNVYGFLPDVSPRVALEDLVRRDPDVILAGPDGARQISANPAWRALRAVREERRQAVVNVVCAR